MSAFVRNFLIISFTLLFTLLGFFLILLRFNDSASASESSVAPLSMPSNEDFSYFSFDFTPYLTAFVITNSVYYFYFPNTNITCSMSYDRSQTTDQPLRFYMYSNTSLIATYTFNSPVTGSFSTSLRNSNAATNLATSFTISSSGFPNLVYPFFYQEWRFNFTQVRVARTSLNAGSFVWDFTFYFAPLAQGGQGCYITVSFASPVSPALVGDFIPCFGAVMLTGNTLSTSTNVGRVGALWYGDILDGAGSSGDSYRDGYNNGYEFGYDKGFSDGEDFGYVDGFQNGYGEANATVSQDSASWSAGYNDGYNNGVLDSSDADYSFFGLISAVLEVPVKVFVSLFSLDLSFGTDSSGNAITFSLYPFIAGLLAVCVVIAIVRRIL